MTTTGAPLELNVLKDADEVATAVAEALVARLEKLQATLERPARLVLAGGGIAEAVHRQVAQAPGAVDWTRVEVWFGDERYVESFSHERNSLAARRDLLGPVGATLVHEPPATDCGLPLHDAVATWAQDFPEADFDLVMLGMGPDGHTASLFPGLAGVTAEGDAVGVADSPKPPPLRLSMTLGRLSAATEVWLMATGQAKAEAVAAAMQPDADVNVVPACGPQGRELTLWWLDRDAASLL